MSEEKAKISKVILTHWHNDHVGGLDGVLLAGLTSGQPEIIKFKRKEKPDNIEQLHSYSFVQDGETVSVEGFKVK